MPKVAFKNKLGRVRQRKGLSSPAAVLGSRGGKKGGPARAQVLTASERSAIASKGGQARVRARTTSYRAMDD